LVFARRGTTRRAKVARRKGNVAGKNRTFGRRGQLGRAALRREQWERSENEHRVRKEKKKRKETSHKKRSRARAETFEKRIGDTAMSYSGRTALRREQCDGFAQSITLWSQRNPLLGKHIPEVTRSVTELRLLRSERSDKHVFVTMDFHGYELAYIRSRGGSSRIQSLIHSFIHS
jgi:hypothetical protein